MMGQGLGRKVVRTIRETRQQFVEVVKQDDWANVVNVRFFLIWKGEPWPFFKRCHGRTMMTNGERQKKEKKKKKRVKTAGNSDSLSTPLTRPCVYRSIFIWDNVQNEKNVWWNTRSLNGCDIEFFFMGKICYSDYDTSPREIFYKFL